MKFRVLFQIIIGLVCFPAFIISQTVNYQNDVLSLTHEHYRRDLQLSSTKEAPVTVKIWNSDSESSLIASTDQIPYFEFVLNHQLFTANDSLWKYRSHTVRAMGNDGTEIHIVIDGSTACSGLEIHLYQQMFPQTRLVREKLELSSGADQIKLNKLDSKLHFKFPQYGLPIQEITTSLHEIRIATWAGELISEDPGASEDERIGDLNLAHCHMFHPKKLQYTIEQGRSMVSKGPFNIVTSDIGGWIVAYEHASQDYRPLSIQQEAYTDANLDMAQGVKGHFEAGTADASIPFLGLHFTKGDKFATIGVEVLKGGYFDDEVIHNKYETVWSAFAFFKGNMDAASQIIRRYLQSNICEYPASRNPEYYYNTWGFQRDVSSKMGDLRAMMTLETYLEEIGMAAQLDVDLFVLDDGWEVEQGDWRPNAERLPNGLKPIKEELDRRGIKMGIWFSPMGIASNTERFKAHSNWVIRDDLGEPVKAQWDHPAFDFVSDFKDLFIEDCKRLIDQGADFFKWDAMNSFRSYQPGLHHGGNDQTKQEIIDRYDYLLPFYVTDAMRQLVEYKNELVIEVDVTEERRTIIGLMPLAYGKFFWMNNGASSYGDYSTYRAKSMRTIINEFAGVVPLGLFTFANYPQEVRPYSASRYNTNTSLIAGHGFWGNLRLMSDRQREQIGKKVSLSKRVLPYIWNVDPTIIGRVGSSPEIYSSINEAQGVGQIIAFSGSVLKHSLQKVVKSDKVLAVLKHSYQFRADTLSVLLTFNRPDDTKEIFIIPNDDDVWIKSSTCWLDDVTLESGFLSIRTGTAGEQVVMISKEKPYPIIKSDDEITYRISQEDQYWRIDLQETEKANILVNLR